MMAWHSSKHSTNYFSVILVIHGDSSGVTPYMNKEGKELGESFKMQCSTMTGLFNDAY